jgi:WD40 repeat protein
MKTASCACSTIRRSPTHPTRSSSLDHTTAPYAYGTSIPAPRSAPFEATGELYERFNLIRCYCSLDPWTVPSECGIGEPASACEFSKAIPTVSCRSTTMDVCLLAEVSIRPSRSGTSDPAPSLSCVGTPTGSTRSSCGMARPRHRKWIRLPFRRFRNQWAKLVKSAIEPGAMLFSASDDLTIKLWDLNTQTCIRTFSGHKAQVQSIKILMVDMSEEEIREAQYRSSRAFSPPTNSSAFQTGSQSPPQTINGQHTGPLSPHVAAAPPGYDPNSFRQRSRNEEIEPKVFVHSDLPKGEHDNGDRQKKALLITGSLDGTIKMWDVETGVEKATLFG